MKRILLASIGFVLSVGVFGQFDANGILLNNSKNIQWKNTQGTADAAIRLNSSNEIHFESGIGSTFRFYNNNAQSELFTIYDGGIIKAKGEYRTTSANAYRMIYGNFGSFWRQDGTNMYYLITNSGDQFGSWNNLRPFRINNVNGNVYIGNNAFTVLHGSYVGIGTDSPMRKLQVKGGTILLDNYQRLEWINSVGTPDGGITLNSSNELHIEAGSGSTIRFFNNNAQDELMTIKDGGFVGIGTNSPNQKIEIKKSSGDVYFAATGLNNITSYYGQNDLGGLVSLNKANGTNTAVIRSYGISYFNGGNVGIGTTNPNFLLAVKGTIGCGEVIVEDVTSWPDFVFKPNYNLRTLTEVENFITENSHLPDVPSEAEVVENGISLGEMNAILLQKIEELTLYTIEQGKEIESVKAENAELKRENGERKKETERLQKVESELEEIKELINQISK